MPSNKPKIVIYTEEEIIEELDKIAEKNNRSRGNMAETIIKEYIEENRIKVTGKSSISKIG